MARPIPGTNGRYYSDGPDALAPDPAPMHHGGGVHPDAFRGAEPSLGQLFHAAVAKFNAGHYDAATLRRLAAGVPHSRVAASTTVEAHLPEDVVRRAKNELAARREGNFLRAELRATQAEGNPGAPAPTALTAQRIATGIHTAPGVGLHGQLSQATLSQLLDQYKKTRQPLIHGSSAGAYGF